MEISKPEPSKLSQLDHKLSERAPSSSDSASPSSTITTSPPSASTSKPTPPPSTIKCTPCKFGTLLVRKNSEHSLQPTTKVPKAAQLSLILPKNPQFKDATTTSIKLARKEQQKSVYFSLEIKAILTTLQQTKQKTQLKSMKQSIVNARQKKTVEQWTFSINWQKIQHKFMDSSQQNQPIP